MHDLDLIEASDISIAQGSTVKNDEVSVLTDTSAWKQAKAQNNPHTSEGDFPDLIEQYEDLFEDFD